jgi:hypothetical protein
MYMGLSTRKFAKNCVDCWMLLGMTHKPTVEMAAEIMRELSGDPCRVKWHKPQHDGRGYKNFGKWKVATSSKRGILNLASALAPFSITKHWEYRLAVLFLRRSVKSAHYRATALDYAIVSVVRRLKKPGCGEAPVREARELLGVRGNPEPSHLGRRRKSTGRVEGVQTTAVTPKNNRRHECPAPIGDNNNVH